MDVYDTHWNLNFGHLHNESYVIEESVHVGSLATAMNFRDGDLKSQNIEVITIHCKLVILLTLIKTTFQSGPGS